MVMFSPSYLQTWKYSVPELSLKLVHNIDLSSFIGYERPSNA